MPLETYAVLLYSGLAGVIGSVFLGFLRFGGHRSGSHGGHHHGLAQPRSHVASPKSVLPNTTRAASPGHTHSVQKASQLQVGQQKGPTSTAVAGNAFFKITVGLLSPITIFSLMMGAGATGLLLRTFFGGAFLVGLACVGALIFSFGIVTPLSNLILKFESQPAQSLEGTISKLAKASGNFDSKGMGVIVVEVDGQLRQILAVLDQDEILEHVSVHKGDSVMIVSLEPGRNLCTVSRKLGLD